MPQPLWTFENVTLQGTHRPRLSRVSCEIPLGVTAVAGDSGAGKSSLLSLLVGFERPDAGRITCHDPATSERLSIYWLPPGNGLWSHLSVLQHLDVVRPPAADSSARIDELLTRFDLDPLRRARPDDLSQGERARLGMARALASQAQVLVLDEPLVHTSILRQSEYWRTAQEFAAQQSTSFVFASHDLESIAREAQYLLILDKGQLAYCGPLESPATPLHNGDTHELLERILNHHRSHEKTSEQSKQNRGSD